MSLRAGHGGGGSSHGGRCTVGDRVQRGRNVAGVRVGRRIAKGAEVVLARVFLLVFAREVQAVAAIAAVMGALVSATYFVSPCCVLGSRVVLVASCAVSLCCVVTLAFAG